MEKREILIVEDEVWLLKDLMRLYDWEDAGYMVFTAANGVQGLQEFVRRRPGIVMTDIRMPHMDGLEMIERIQELAPETKFIILSTYGEFEYAHEAIRLGVKDYLLKKDLSRESIQTALDAVSAPERSPFPDGIEKTTLSPIVERAAAYIREHYSEPGLRIGRVSVACGISAGRLSARFREEMDTTVNEYITFVRIETAKRLLAGKQYKVYEVAEMVGYRNSEYFSTLFQEHTGMRPNKYHE